VLDTLFCSSSFFVIISLSFTLISSFLSVAIAIIFLLSSLHKLLSSMFGSLLS
jgi:hypothetical protein